MKRVLFLCVANSARSQMAEALCNKYFKGLIEARSAGSEPSGRVNPHAIKAMELKGIDMSAHTSKSIYQLSNEFINDLDYVITLCIDENCPYIPGGSQYLHWPFPDPYTLEDFKVIANSIEKKLFDFEKKHLRVNHFSREEASLDQPHF